MKGYNNDYDYGGGSGAGGPRNGIDYNPAGSSSVGQVGIVSTVSDAHSIPVHGEPNSVTRNYRDGELSSERYYDENGDAYLDIDYSDHGNPGRHPDVPHEHRIWFDDNGTMHREDSDGGIK